MNSLEFADGALKNRIFAWTETHRRITIRPLPGENLIVRELGPVQNSTGPSVFAMCLLLQKPFDRRFQQLMRIVPELAKIFSR